MAEWKESLSAPASGAADLPGPLWPAWEGSRLCFPAFSSGCAGEPVRTEDFSLSNWPDS